MAYHSRPNKGTNSFCFIYPEHLIPYIIEGEWKPKKLRSMKQWLARVNIWQFLNSGKLIRNWSNCFQEYEGKIGKVKWFYILLGKVYSCKHVKFTFTLIYKNSYTQGTQWILRDNCLFILVSFKWLSSHFVKWKFYWSYKALERQNCHIIS